MATQHFIRQMQDYTAQVSVGASTVRGQRTPGLVTRCRQLLKEQGPSKSLPRWLGVKHLTLADHACFQSRASVIAAKQALARVQPSWRRQSAAVDKDHEFGALAAFGGTNASKADIEAWVSRTDVRARGKRLMAGFDSWKGEHSSRSDRSFFGLPYIMLHSLSHLLITAVSLECGYPASSIRERIYALPDIGYGILLYTGTTDAEGTLGGLVEVGRRIHDHVRTALEIGDLCSNDPVCAEHDPVNEHERRFLHGAACHGCLLIAETSCEQHNDFLDRALVVKTVQNLGVEFFPDELL